MAALSVVAQGVITVGLDALPRAQRTTSSLRRTGLNLTAPSRIKSISGGSRVGRVGATRRAFLRVEASSEADKMVETIKKQKTDNPVIIYSKSWCPYCTQVKGLFKKLGYEYTAIELDQSDEEGLIQYALLLMTNQTTVPNVFIGGEHVGGCDDTMALHRKGQLLPLLEKVGAKA